VAAAKIKRRLTKSTQQDEFHVKTSRVLKELLDPEEVQEGDRWGFVDAGSSGLVIVRYRETITPFAVEEEEENEVVRELSVGPSSS